MKKQRYLAIVLVLVFIMTSIPTFNLYADTISKEAQACKDLGILIGADASGVTSEYLAKTPTRIQAFIIFLRLKGLYNDATGYESDNNFKDSSTSSWAKNYMAYAKNNSNLGWVGYPDGTFAPNNTIDGKAFYKVMLETLGYRQNIDFTYTDTLKFAEQIGLVKSAAEISSIKSFTVNDVAKGIYNTLNTKPQNSDKKLITLLVENQVITADNAVLAGFTLDTKEAKVVKFQCVANNRLELEFDREIALQKGDIEITQIGKNSRLSVLNVQSSKNKAIITTTEGAAFSAYSITINTLIPVNGVVIRNYKNRYVAMPKDTVKPGVASKPEPISNNEVAISFTEEVDRNTAENLSNYIIERDVTVLSAQLSEDGKQVVLRTTEQAQDSFYKITIQNICDIAGNRMDKYSNYFDGLTVDNTEPTVTNVQSVSSTSVIVTFSERVDSAAAENVNNYTLDNNLLVIDAKLDDSGKTVKLTTSEQNPGVYYKLTVKNITDTHANVMYKKDFRFTGDSTKPTASVVALTNNEVQVSFSEKVDKSTAEDVRNYSISDLQVQSASLDGTGKIVTLITSNQTVHAIYNIMITGVTDLWGNSVNLYTGKFGGMPENKSAITYTVTSTPNNIIITFNKRMNKETAEDVFNYTLDNDLGYAAKATLDSDATGKVVTLLTDNQTAGKLYSITVQNVQDFSGNAISTDTKVCTKKFVGANGGNSDSSTTGLNLISIVTVDVNTVDLLFDNDLTKDEMDSLKVAVNVASGGSNMPTGMDYIKNFLSNKKTVRVQFKTSASNNPTLFSEGNIYEAKVTGIDRLTVGNDYNIKQFAGTSIMNEPPAVLEVKAVNSTAVQVKFSEPVKGITASQFSINNGVTVNGVSIGSVDEISDTVLLYLSSGTALTDDKTYRLYIKSGIKDAAGLNSVTASSSSSNSYLEFDGTSEKNEAPTLNVLTVADKYTLTLEFSEPIKNFGTSSFSIRRISGGNGSSQYIINKVVASDDKKTITLYYNSKYSSFSADSEYEMTLGSSICDLQNQSISSENRKASFNGVDIELEKLEIVATSISEDNKVITLVTNRDIDSEGLSMDYLSLLGADYYRNSADTAECKGNTIIITLRNALGSNETLTIEISNTGMNEINDYNNQKLATNRVEVKTR